MSSVVKPQTTEWSLADLNQDCLLLVLSFLCGPKLWSLSRLSRKFGVLVKDPCLWHHSVVSGPVLTATNFVEKVLVPRAKDIHSLTFQDIRGLPLLPPDNDLQFHLTSTFFASLDTLLQKCGPHLRSLVIHDSDDSFLFSLSHVLFASIAQYARGLKRVVLAGTEETVYVEDSNVLLLTRGCAGVEEFVDGQSYGVTTEALHYMADGWKCLHSLSINTELQDLETFITTVSEFGPRLRSLAVTHFRDSLKDSCNIHLFARGLSRLSKLEKLSVDLQMTRHRDGLYASDWDIIFSTCPLIKELEYVVPFEAYFEDEEVVSDGHLPLQPHGRRPSGEVRTASEDGGSGGILMRSESGEWVEIGAGDGGAAASAAAAAAAATTTTVIATSPAATSSRRYSATDFYGNWSSDDSRSVSARAGVGESDEKRHREFFQILEDIRALCEEREIKLVLKWSI
ncbi:hypothetical protein HK104_004159 [Borealophlyctis nickersoniae]|nr:hypothetical protein HK104_004159 [Borealophlyctis nickersoniae]